MDYKHESQGMVKLSKVKSSHPVNLFGSRVPVESTIRLRVQQGLLHRELNYDKYSARGETIIEVEMSELQFAEMITSVGQGDGVPVTLRNLNGVTLQEPVYESEMETFSKEFSKEMAEISRAIKALTMETKDRLNDSKPLNKTERQDIISTLEGVEQFFRSTAPYMERTFNENMTRTMNEVMMSIKALTVPENTLINAPDKSSAHVQSNGEPNEANKLL